MGRPKGSKDKKKRKVKTILNGVDERNLIKDYEDGYSTKILLDKYNVTKSYMSLMFKNRGIKSRIDQSVVKSWEHIENIDSLDSNICGIYVIYFLWNYDKNDPERNIKVNNIKVYIGASINIKKRLQDHMYHLGKKSHRSKNMQEWYDKDNYSIRCAIIERCESNEIMQKETDHIKMWSESCLLNTWSSNKEEDLRPWLEEAVKRDAYAKHFVINENTGCKESCNVHKSGYARMKVIIKSLRRKNGDGKYFYKHRVAFWEKYGTYPELIRHKCNNPRCYNADHLAEGTYQDNALDKRGDFPKEFEDKWKECGADIIKLSEHYESRWNRNCELSGEKVSYMIYSWERKLGLREKYPEILKSNKNRRLNTNV